MIHSRPDYQRLQDPAGLIPQDEPVFLLRAQDKTAAQVVAIWALMQPEGPLKEMAERHANRMGNWKKRKWADITPGQRGEDHGLAPGDVAQAMEFNQIGFHMREADAGRIAELERQLASANELASNLDRKRVAASGMYEEAVRGRGAANDRLDAAVLARDALLRSAIAAGCAEVGSQKHLVNQRADNLLDDLNRLGRQRTYDLDRCADAHKATLQKLAALKRQLSQSGHDMDTAGQCNADCPACEKIRESARSEMVDALDHLHGCPPNMCRDGHPEIRYEVPGDGEPHGCPLCRALSKLASWERKLSCGHPEAALIVEDPPYCAVCDREARIADLERRLHV